MKIVVQPHKKDWRSLLQRPYVDNKIALQKAEAILKAVQEEGDIALKRLGKELEGIELQELKVSKEEIDVAAEKLTPKLKAAIQQAKSNIERFHQSQLQTSEVVTTMPGVDCWQKWVPIDKVGLYIPGGTAPLFSTVLMLAVPAQIADCKSITLCTPPDKQGNIHPAILYTASLTGITTIYKLGGAQAIAAMAYGTETIDAVYKIFGPGNQYVTAAKQLVQMQGVAIDMPAGPSEVCVMADETANAAFVAADLLSQAEHGVDSQVLLISTNESLVNEANNELNGQLALLPRQQLAQKALANSKAIVVKDMEEAIDLANAYAAEHLIISCKNADAIAQKITNAGSVFIGNYSPESVGDYASGTNHTLPTNGFAKAYSGLSTESFMKKITYQKLTQEGLQAIAPTVITMAEGEGLQAHAEAVRIRVKSLQKEKQTFQ